MTAKLGIDHHGRRTCRGKPSRNAEVLDELLNFLGRARKLQDEQDYLDWKRREWKLAPDIARLVAKRMAEIEVELDGLVVAAEWAVSPSRVCPRRLM